MGDYFFVLGEQKHIFILLFGDNTFTLFVVWVYNYGFCFLLGPFLEGNTLGNLQIFLELGGKLFPKPGDGLLA